MSEDVKPGELDRSITLDSITATDTPEPNVFLQTYSAFDQVDLPSNTSTESLD